MNLRWASAFFLNKFTLAHRRLTNNTIHFTYRINRTVAINGTDRRFKMINLNRLGIGGIVFLVGAVIYIINLVLALRKRRTTIPIDGVGLMVLGIGLSSLLKL